MLYLKRLKLIFVFSFLLHSAEIHSQELEPVIHIPFSTNDRFITVYNGDRYVPFAIKGVTFGVAKPGLFPGQLEITRKEAGRWLGLIKEAGFNTVRLYTLFFPDFYEVLDSFNLANPRTPLFIFQGIWLDEEIAGYNNDLHMLTSTFNKEIEDNIACIHGNKTIPQRAGKAYGTYKKDVSPWVIGYILGREVSPWEIIKTNLNHPADTAFNGDHFSIGNASPAESWVTQRLDHVLKTETRDYATQRPLSFSSWPTLDPLVHPSENHASEDTASLDLRNIIFKNAPAGYFACYHAYPYYPNFVSRDANYQFCEDDIGLNSYLCYLQDLKRHYINFPLIIGEYGCPSSWGIAHYAQNGVNHGGFDESEQGRNNMRLLKNIFDSYSGGGCMFNWMDEWFKRTWITDKMDFDPDRRILWQNVTAAEQNFGLIGFRKNPNELKRWENFCTQCPVTSLEAGSDYSFFNLRINLLTLPGLLDTVWVALDTYDSRLGESILLNGQTVTNRAEFLLRITYYKAELFVTQAYDLYGNYHKVSDSVQLYHSIPTDGSPWKIVRWKNDDLDINTQYIGDLKVNRYGMPVSSKDAVYFNPSSIDIHLPWTLINYSDPSRMRVIHDNRSTPQTEDTVSDGIAVYVYADGYTAKTSTRFTWTNWNVVDSASEYLKQSYFIIKENQPELTGDPVSFADSYVVSPGSALNVSVENGLLANDYLTNYMNAEVVLDEAPSSGIIFLDRDGSFTYIPDPLHFGKTSFTYRTICGEHKSWPGKVNLFVGFDTIDDPTINLYPNPSSGIMNVHSPNVIDEIEIFDAKGSIAFSKKLYTSDTVLDLRELPQGVYYVQLYSGGEKSSKPVLLVR